MSRSFSYWERYATEGMLISSTPRLFQCFFTVDRGTFQQYAIADAARAIKVCTLLAVCILVQ